MFYRELATMIGSGMDIIGSINILSKHADNKKLKTIFFQIKQYLLKGNTLSNALYKFPKLFPEWQINIIKSTEMGGKLEEGLKNIANYLEKKLAARNKIISGLAYPFLLLHLSFILLPLPIIVTKNVSGYIIQVLKTASYFYLFITGMYILRKLWVARSKEGYDTFILNLPVFGSLIKRINLIRFIYVLKYSYDSGVNVIKSWQAAASSCNNSIIKKSLLKGLLIIEKGEKLADAFQQTKVFPGKMLGLIDVGERSGSIDKILEKIALYSEEENKFIINNLVKIIPVVIYLIIAVYITYKIISSYMSH
jgi:type IV pilus assembly protein PilC